MVSDHRELKVFSEGEAGGSVRMQRLVLRACNCLAHVLPTVLLSYGRSCESTMRVLRAAKDELMTILAVLMYDPLYNWSMTPEKANRIQAGSNDSRDRNAAVSANPSGSSDDKNKMAERVLRRVSQKLDGHEEGHLLSVEGQVNVLIQQARDPVRLGNLYVGWQAYL